MNAEGDAEYNAAFSIGAHSVGATYNGDQSYNKFTAPTPITFTVVKDTPDVYYGASNLNSSGDFVAGQPTVFNVIVENNAQVTACNPSPTTGQCTNSIAPVPVLPPTGTVTISSSGGSSGFNGSATLSAGVDPSDGAQAGIGAITLGNLSPGTYNVTFTYNGENNYASETLTTGQYPFVVVAGSSLTPSVTTASLSGAISPNSTLIVSGTVTGSGTTAPTGYVLFFSSGYDLGVVPLTPATGDVSTFSATITSQDILQGANFITVQYLGDTRYAPSNSRSSSPLQNPLSDFTLVPNTTLVPVNISAGALSGTVTINVASVNSFSGNVNLTCKATSPVTCSITSPVALSRGSSGASPARLPLTHRRNTPTGSYDVSVVGADAATGEFVHTLSITASVSAFTLTNGGNIVVVQGATTGNTSTIAVTPASGFTGAVNLSCAVTSAPAGATNPVTCSTANLNPASVNITGAAAQTSILTINTR